jgi:outer membrane autotransporter protein
MNIVNQPNSFVINGIKTENQGAIVDVRFLTDSTLIIRGTGNVIDKQGSGSSVSFFSTIGKAGSIKIEANSGNVIFDADIKNSGSNMIKNIDITGSNTVTFTDSNGSRVGTITNGAVTTFSNNIEADNFSFTKNATFNSNLIVNNKINSESNNTARIKINGDYTQKSNSTIQLHYDAENLNLSNLSVSPIITANNATIESNTTLDIILPTLTLPLAGLPQDGTKFSIIKANNGLNVNVNQLTLTTNNSNQNIAISLDSDATNLYLVFKQIIAAGGGNGQQKQGVMKIINNIQNLDNNSNLYRASQVANQKINQELQQKRNNEIAISSSQMNLESISVIENRMQDIVVGNGLQSFFSRNKKFSTNLATNFNHNSLTKTDAPDDLASLFSGKNNYVGGVWGQVIAKKYNQGFRKGEEGFSGNLGGVVIGGDIQLDQFSEEIFDQNIFGVAFAFLNNNTKGKTNGGTEVESKQFSLYHSVPSLNESNFFVNSVASYTNHDFTTSRNISLISTTAKAGFGGKEYSVKSGIGYNLRYNERLKFIPTFDILFSQLKLDDYQEYGAGNAGLIVKNKNYNTLLTSTSLVTSNFTRLNGNYDMINNFTIGYSRNLISSGQKSSAKFLAGGEEFSQTGVSRQKNFINLGFENVLASQGRFSLSTKYVLQFAEKFISHTGMLQVRMGI